MNKILMILKLRKKKKKRRNLKKLRKLFMNGNKSILTKPYGWEMMMISMKKITSISTKAWANNQILQWIGFILILKEKLYLLQFCSFLIEYHLISTPTTIQERMILSYTLEEFWLQKSILIWFLNTWVLFKELLILMIYHWMSTDKLSNKLKHSKSAIKK